MDKRKRDLDDSFWKDNDLTEAERKLKVATEEMEICQAEKSMQEDMPKETKDITKEAR